MKQRPLGATGLVVSEIGFGGWGIGGRTDGETSYGDTDDAVSLDALAQALDLGINFFDTSSVYGYGHSETLIGQALTGRREGAVIATKAGFVRYGAEPDFRPAQLRASLEGSLRRLQTDYVDLLQLHNPPLALLRGDPAILETLQTLRREGKVRAFGLSAKSPAEAMAAIEEFDFAVVQANLNMMDLRAIECGLLDAAARRNVAVIARTPLCFGFLSGAIGPDTRFPPGDHRGGWPRSQIARWCEGARRLRDAAAAPGGGSAIQVALRFCLSFPAVATVIPGMLTRAEVVENAAASELGPLPAAAIARLRELNRSLELFAPA